MAPMLAAPETRYHDQMQFFEWMQRGLANRRWAVVLGLLVVAILVWRSARAPEVAVLVLQPAELVRTVQFSGRLTSQTRVEIGSTVTGRVTEVRAREGESVRAGALLLQLDSTEAEASLAQAKANLSQAEARLQGLRSTGRLLTQASLAQAQASLQAARAEVTRTQQLLTQGFVSPARLDEALRALGVAQALHDGASAQVQANTDAGSETQQAQAQLDAARATLEGARARLEQTRLRTPADAQVLERTVEPGQIVQPGKTLLSLALTGPAQVKAQVDERFLAQLAPGQTASVLADAYPGQAVPARIQQIAPAVDAQRGAIEVTLALTSPPPAFLREDMTLSIEVETARRPQALALPLTALRPGASSSSDPASEQGEVLVVVDGRTQSRQVRLGVRSLQAVEVLEGLLSGETVLLDGSGAANQRVRVQVTAPTPTAAPPS